MAAHDLLTGPPGNGSTGEYYHRKSHGSLTEPVHDRQGTVEMVPARPPLVDPWLVPGYDFMGSTWLGTKLRKGSV